MAIAAAANADVAYKLESSYGVNPGGNFKYARYYTSGLTPNTQTIENDEVTPQRLPAGLVVTDIAAQGALVVPFVPNDQDDFIQAAMMSSWSTLVNLSAQSIDISGASGNTATITDAATSGAFTNIVVGQWLELGGYETAANNGLCRCTAKASNNELTVEGLVFVNEAGDTDITVKARMIRPGTTKTSLAIEHQFPDTTAALYDLYLGAMIQGMTMENALGSAVRMSFDMIAKFPTESTSSGAGTPTAAGTIDPANVVHNFSGFREGSFGANSGIDLRSLSLNFTNGLSPLGALGTLGPIEIALGRVSVTGSFTAYLEDWTLAQKYRQRTDTKLSWRHEWSSGESYVITLPAVTLGGCARVLPGRDGAVVQDVAFSAKMDSNGQAFQIDGPF